MFHSRDIRYTWGLSHVFVGQIVYVHLVYVGDVVLSWVSG